MLITNITQVIGNTPLLEVPTSFHGLDRLRLFLKLEFLNPWGSVKDRTAWNLLKDELTRIAESGQTVIESSSGRTGIAMQVLCAMHGIPFELVTNRIYAPEVAALLTLLGADLLEMPGLRSCPDPTDPQDPLTFIHNRMAAQKGARFHPSQYENDLNTRVHYEHTGPEIFADGGAMDFLIAALGTSGSSRGIGQFLKEKNDRLKIIGVASEADNVIPGMRDANELQTVGIFDAQIYDGFEFVSVGKALEVMLRLNRKLGLLCGPSSGASFAAAMQHITPIIDTIQPQAGEDKVKVCILLPDRIELYLQFLRNLRPDLFQMPQTKGLLDELDPEDAGPGVSADEAEEWLKDPDTLVVDMRGNMIFEAGHLPRSINLMPGMILDLCKRGVIFSRSHRLLLVCPYGIQSGRFAAALKAQGFKCASLRQGFNSWLRAGKELYPKP